ncbi:MAG: adenylate/guanylate cyclase domain-containing protein [Geitlerinemataceae cyanobacterium]
MTSHKTKLQIMMRTLDRLTIRSKLIVMLLAASIFSIGVTAIVGYQSGRKNLTERVFSQLTSLRSAKAKQIESYMEIIRNQAKTLGEDLTVQMALSEFTDAYLQLENAEIPANADRTIKSFYTQQFIPKLAKLQNSKPVMESYLPKSIASSYLQYYYIADNIHPLGEKQKLDFARDSSKYSQAHDRFHPFFRSFIEKFGYYDLFLIDPQGNIVYTVFKETDYTTNLETGVYRNSNLAKVFEYAKNAQEREYTKLVDFEPYRASYDAPAAFIATPVYQESKFVGVLALQLPVDKINSVMTGDRNWQDNGLGESGETYLVGSDYLMRSISRFLIEDRDGYIQTLRSQGVAEETLTKIQEYNTSILEQKVETETVTQAISGKTGTKIVKDYRDVPVLSSYTKLAIPDLDWVILAELDVSEAYAPIYEFQKRLSIASSLMILVIVIASMGMTYIFVRPINHLMLRTHQVETGEAENFDNLELYDELGDLAQSFNKTVFSLRQQKVAAEVQSFENEKLVTKVFSPGIAQRLKKEGEDIFDRIDDVSILFIQILGLKEIFESWSDEESFLFLNELVKTFDKNTEIYTIEKVKMIGDCYVAACGLSNPYLDGDKRSIEFALSLQSIVFRLNHEKNINLELQIGIHSGKAIAGIIGRDKLIYDLWGNTVDTARNLMIHALPGGILVSKIIFDRLHDLYEFKSMESVNVSCKEPIQAWQFTSKKLSQSQAIKA